jgi:preprotein translocase subunit SecD
MRNFIIFVITMHAILHSFNCFSSEFKNRPPSITFQIIDAQMTFDSSNVTSAAVIKQNDNSYEVEIKLNKMAAEQLDHLTSSNIGKRANTIFNGKILSVSVILSQLGHRFIISGFSKEEAEKFVGSIIQLSKNVAH